MNFKRLATGVDVQPLLQKLAARPDLWDAEPGRSQYPGSAHAMAQSILLRWPEAARGAFSPITIAVAFRSLEAVDCPAARELMPEAGALFEGLRALVEPVEDYGRVMITRLPPGASITKHVDEGLYADAFDRFHVCLQASKGASFYAGSEVVEMAPGEIWWFNHKREHAVVNRGEVDRIHLIVDLACPAYRQLRGTYVQAELVTDIWDELIPLLEAHWSEVAHYKDIPLDPDREAYTSMERAGMIRCYTARDGVDLVGYVVFFVRPNMHYRSSRQAMQDVMFLLPEYRRGRTGLTLIKVSETRLRAEGVQVVYHHAKRSNLVGRLLERLGYELVDGIYGKRLD